MSEIKVTRTRNIFDPQNPNPFKISRTRLENYLQCARCFYLDRRLGVSQPPGYPFSLNNAVDSLLKKEFDEFRQRGLPHPLMQKFGFKGIPFQHEKLDEWRDSLRAGITFHHKASNLILTGGVDDLWINDKKEICIVDYKATAKYGSVSVDADWQISYRRQADIYAWLFRQNGYAVSDTAYFVYCNGILNRDKFDARLDFTIDVIPYKTNDTWVSATLVQAAETLKKSAIPDYTEGCPYCNYQRGIQQVTSQQSFNLD